MLVLTRKVGEQIVVPQCQLTVSVMGIVGKRVRLGISAPHDVVVYRQEVQQRMAAEASPIGQDLLRSARVLIADPDKLLLAAYSQHLTQRGASVSTARTGLECLEKLMQSVPDVLVLEPELLWGGGDGVSGAAERTTEYSTNHRHAADAQPQSKPAVPHVFL